MKLIQSRRKLYAGDIKLLFNHDVDVKVYEHTFNTHTIIEGGALRHLKANLQNLDFLQLIAASGFQNKINPTTLERLKLAPDYDTEQSFYSAEGLLITHTFQDNLLYLFSFGEIEPDKYVFWSEGVWDMTPFEKQIQTPEPDKPKPKHQFQGNMGEPDTVSSYILMHGVDPRTNRPPIKDLQELHDAFIANGWNNFYIKGFEFPAPTDVDMLGFENGNWYVCYTERGQRSEPFFTTPDRDEAIAFYYNHIKKIEHGHLVVFTSSSALLEEYRSRLETAGIRTIQNNDPNHREMGNGYRLFVTNSDIFIVQKMFPVVPYYDAVMRKKIDAKNAVIPDEPKQEETEEPNNTPIDIAPPASEKVSEPDAVQTFVPFHDGEYFPEIRPHNQTLFKKQLRQLIKVTAVCGIIAIALHLLDADGLSALFLLFFIVLMLWLPIFWFMKDMRKPAFMVTKDGVFINQQFLRNAFVPWENIAKAELRGYTATPAIIITFKDIKTLLKGQFFVLRSLAKAQLQPHPTMVISWFETEGDLKRTFAIMKQYLPAEKTIEAIPYDYEGNRPSIKKEPTYIRLEDNRTKEYYREILDQALRQAEEEYRSSPGMALYESFFNQLTDIRKTVVEQGVVYTEAEADKRYPLGIMAIRNFDGYPDDWDYPKKLVDISSGVSQYHQMPEK